MARVRHAVSCVLPSVTGDITWLLTDLDTEPVHVGGHQPGAQLRLAHLSLHQPRHEHGDVVFTWGQSTSVVSSIHCLDLEVFLFK